MTGGQSVSQFDGQVASVVDATGRQGYLLVRVWRGSVKIGRKSEDSFSTDLLLALSGSDGKWECSDRADPPDYDTAAELATGSVDWHGNALQLKWMSDTEAETVKRDVFE